jgi:putative acetyltransferase
MRIMLDDLTGAAIIALLQEHMSEMHAISPPESVHALDLHGLKKPQIRCWSIWDGERLAGCGALKHLNATHGEIKSMRTARPYRGKGVASLLLQHLLIEARTSGLTRLSLETGAMAFFAPARQLYHKFGFEPCGPFADYREDPNSVFMDRNLD